MVKKNSILLNYINFKTPHYKEVRGWFQLAYSRVFISEFMRSE